MKLLATLALTLLGAVQGQTVADRVYVNGDLVAENNGMAGAHGCTPSPEGEHNTFKVCGCNVKLVAHLRQECQAYGKYSQDVGHCDCKNSDCDEVSLESGYTDKFKWHAGSYEIKSC